MLQLKQLYSTVIREPKYGVQGYHVDKKYFDSRRSREQKILVNSKERSSTMKPSLASKKSNFLDQILRKEAKLPGPSTYSPKQYERSVQKIKVQSPPRMTYIQQMQKMQQKYNFPAPGKYDKLETEVDKTKKQSSGLSKAEVCNYLDNSMRNSIEKPGVGSYNAKIQLFDKKGVIIWKKPKEVKDKKSMSQRGIKAAEVGTYTPIPVSYEIFDSISHLKPKKSKSYFNKQQRFKNSKDKAVPFYNVGSEWGMKDKIHKKDILSRVGSSLTHHSIYY